MYNAPASILKSGRSDLKRRPKTAVNKTKSRQVENPEVFANSAMPGMNFSPY
jgi:hypothetical protein